MTDIYHVYLSFWAGKYFAIHFLAIGEFIKKEFSRDAVMSFSVGSDCLAGEFNMCDIFHYKCIRVVVRFSIFFVFVEREINDEFLYRCPFSDWKLWQRS
jgi:hypothetical protein